MKKNININIITEKIMDVNLTKNNLNNNMANQINYPQNQIQI